MKKLEESAEGKDNHYNVLAKETYNRRRDISAPKKPPLNIEGILVLSSSRNLETLQILKLDVKIGLTKMLQVCVCSLLLLIPPNGIKVKIQNIYFGYVAGRYLQVFSLVFSSYTKAEDTASILNVGVIRK